MDIIIYLAKESEFGFSPTDNDVPIIALVH